MTTTLDDMLRPSNGSITAHPGRKRPPETVATVDVCSRARRSAAALMRAGVVEGDLVATTMDNDVDSVVGLLAIWYSGATAASLPPRRRGASVGDQALESLLAEAGCRFHVVSRRASARFDAVTDLIVEQLAETGATGAPDRPIAADALVQFTSGSAGRPKGVVITAQGVAGHIAALMQMLEVDPARDTTVTWLPLSHDMGLVGTCLVPLCSGAHFHLMTPRDFITYPMRWLEVVTETRSTILAAPDFAWRLLSASSLERAQVDLSSVRVALMGAERVRRSTIEAVATTLGQAGLPWESITPTYGMAEATLAVTCTPIGAGPSFRGDDVGVGGPLPGVEVRIGPDGVLSIRSPHGFRGYLRGTEIEDPRDDDGWFLTGDAGAFVEGDLVIRGRVDEVVISAGRNVYAEDVEQVLLDQMDGEVAGVAAFRRHDDDSSFGVLVEMHQGFELDAGLRRRITAAVSMALETRPSSIHAVEMGQMPRTSSGKVRRAECRALVSSLSRSEEPTS